MSDEVLYCEFHLETLLDEYGDCPDCSEHASCQCPDCNYYAEDE